MPKNTTVTDITLAQLREKCGLTTGMVATRMGQQKQTVTNVENAKETQVSTLFAYLAALDTVLELRCRVKGKDYVINWGLGSVSLPEKEGVKFGCKHGRVGS